MAVPFFRHETGTEQPASVDAGTPNGFAPQAEKITARARHAAAAAARREPPRTNLNSVISSLPFNINQCYRPSRRLSTAAGHFYVMNVRPENAGGRAEGAKKPGRMRKKCTKWPGTDKKLSQRLKSS